MKKNIETISTEEAVPTAKKISVIRVALVISCLAILTFAVAGCSGDKDSDKKASDSGEKTYSVSLVDAPEGMRIDPAVLTVKKGENVVLKVTNDGTVPHNLTMDDGMATADLVPYSSATFEIGKVDADMTVHCAIPGHKDQGMVMDIKVEN